MPSPNALMPLLLLGGAAALLAVSAGSQKKIGGETDSDTGDSDDTSIDDLPPPPGSGVGVTDFDKYNFIPSALNPERGGSRAPDPGGYPDTPPPGGLPPAPPAEQETTQALLKGVGPSAGAVNSDAFRANGNVNQGPADSLQLKGWFRQGYGSKQIFKQIKDLEPTFADFAIAFDALADSGDMYVSGRMRNSPSPAQVFSAYADYNRYLNLRGKLKGVPKAQNEFRIKSARKKFYAYSDPWRWAGILYLIALGNR